MGNIIQSQSAKQITTIENNIKCICYHWDDSGNIFEVVMSNLQALFQPVEELFTNATLCTFQKLHNIINVTKCSNPEIKIGNITVESDKTGNAINFEVSITYLIKCLSKNITTVI